MPRRHIVRESRVRVILKREDFVGLSDDDTVYLRVRPTGNDRNYKQPFVIEIPVKWWNATSFVRQSSWTDDGVWSFATLTDELKQFIKDEG